MALDPDGRYVIVHARIFSQLWAVLGLYLLPLASLLLLNRITAKLAEFASDHKVLLGDCNMAPDPSLLYSTLAWWPGLRFLD